MFLFFFIISLPLLVLGRVETECENDTNWVASDGYAEVFCKDYETNNWCSNGTIGDAWDPSWTWMIGNNGLDARQACCICGGRGKDKEIQNGNMVCKCKTNSILINASANKNHNSSNPTRQIWCQNHNNCCSQMLKSLQFWLQGIVTTSISFIGIIMNILFCYVLSRKDMKNQFNSLLIALAILDSSFLFGSILRAFAGPFGLSTDIHFKLYPQFLYPFHYISLCSSILLTVAISFERNLAVKRPIKRHLKMRNKKRVWLRTFLKYVIPVFAVSIIFCLPTFFEFGEKYDEVTGEPIIKWKELRLNPDYVLYYKGIGRLIVTVIMPFSIVLYFNVNTYKIIKKRRNSKLNMDYDKKKKCNERIKKNPFVMRAHFNSKRSHKNSEETLSMIFLAISCLFLICHFPRFVMDSHDAIFAEDLLECEKARYFQYSLWNVITIYVGDILLALNNSLNSAIYCIFSSKYREQAKIAFKCKFFD